MRGRPLVQGAVRRQVVVAGRAGGRSLDQVAQAFEPGRRYPEQAVNEILKAVYDDHAALRRYLIDESLLSRTPDGTYWRSGGTVPIAQGAQESPGGPERERGQES